ncbi:MAG: hypothetical protein H6730_17000 [Deltaproteobacteria bacterium]|nr:hypothetical protein [Deltaproteobacteria bacterium]
MIRRGLLLAALLASSTAEAQFAPLTVVRPGGGILAADGVSVVPMQIVLQVRDRGPRIRSARIVASEGEITGTRVIGPGRVHFFYKAPERRRGVDEIFDVALTLSDGNTVAEAFTLSIPAASKPQVELTVDPGELLAEAPSSIRVEASAFGDDLEGLEVQADHGRLSGEPVSGRGKTLGRTATLEPPELPPDAPSHLMVVAVAATGVGYAVKVGDVPVAAPVRLSVEIPPGSRLEVNGAKNNPAPVPAPADGRTVMEDVEVDLTSPLTVFEVTGRKRKQLSTVVPTGVVSTGIAVPIPGQAVADGGTGPTVVVVIPPPTFGAPLFWPDIEVEGATLVRTEDVGPRVKALVLARPLEPKTVRVLLDEQAVGTIELGAARGQSVKLESLPARSGERLAASVVVTTPEGDPTDLPTPKVRLEGGDAMPLERVAVGRYRATLPAGYPGAPGTEVEVVAELPPLPKVTGAPLEYAQARLRTPLAGPPPALKAKDAPPPPPPPPPEGRRGHGPKLKVGASLHGSFGGTLGGMLMFGGGLMGEVRLPILDERLAIRVGAEYVRGSKTGRVTFDDERRLETTTTVAGFLFPLDVGFAVLKSESFELLVRAGFALRAERGGIDIQGDTPGAGSRLGFGGRASVEGALGVGSGALFFGAMVDGLGADMSGFSTPQVTLDGSLLNLRGDVGYRFWF